MPQREQTLLVVAPDIGIVWGAPRHAIPDRAWWSVSNARFLRGNAEKVSGYKALQTLDGQVMGLYLYRKSADQLPTDATWIAVTLAKAWKRAKTDSAFVDITGPTPLTGGPTDWVKFATFRDMLIFTNGVDPVKKWTGTGNIADLGGSPPKARHVALFQNHVVLANLTWPEVKPQTLAWSDIGNPEVWSGGLDTGQLTLSDEPTPIIDIKQLRDSLVVYKPDAVYLMDYTVQPFTMSTKRIVGGGVGPISPRSVISAHDVHYFLGSDGMVYRLTMAGPEEIGQAVVGRIVQEINFASAQSVFGWWSPADGELIWAIPTGGSDTPNVAYILNIRDLRWGRRELQATAAVAIPSFVSTLWDNVGDPWDNSPHVWNDSALSSGSPVLLHGDTGGVVYQHGTPDAAGSPVVMDLETKLFDLGDATRHKRVKRLHVHYVAAQGATLEIYVLVSPSPGVPPVSYGPYTMVLDGTGDQWVDLDVTGRWIGFRFVNRDTNKSIRITGYAPVYHVREVT